MFAWSCLPNQIKIDFAERKFFLSPWQLQATVKLSQSRNLIAGLIQLASLLNRIGWLEEEAIFNFFNFKVKIVLTLKTPKLSNQLIWVSARLAPLAYAQWMSTRLLELHHLWQCLASDDELIVAIKHEVSWGSKTFLSYRLLSVEWKRRFQSVLQKRLPLELLHRSSPSQPFRIENFEFIENSRCIPMLHWCLFSVCP